MDWRVQLGASGDVAEWLSVTRNQIIVGVVVTGLFALLAWAHIRDRKRRREEFEHAANSRWATWADEPRPPVRLTKESGMTILLDGEPATPPRLSAAEQEEYDAIKREAVKRRKAEEEAARDQEAS